MKILKSKEFIERLKDILQFIAEDKPKASKKFYLKLDEKINKLAVFPYKYRKSIYFDNENIRDMIFKGYTIVYEVDLKKEKIIIFTIFNKNRPV